MSQDKVTILDLHNMLKDIVCKYPYYEVQTIDTIMGKVMVTKLKPQAKIDREDRILYLETSML